MSMRGDNTLFTNESWNTTELDVAFLSTDQRCIWKQEMIGDALEEHNISTQKGNRQQL